MVVFHNSNSLNHENFVDFFRLWGFKTVVKVTNLIRLSRFKIKIFQHFRVHCCYLCKILFEEYHNVAIQYLDDN